jgi:hypothetical protein
VDDLGLLPSNRQESCGTRSNDTGRDVSGPHLLPELNAWRTPPIGRRSWAGVAVKTWLRSPGGIRRSSGT